MLTVYVFIFCSVDSDSALYSDLQTLKEKEGKDGIILNFTYKVRTASSRKCVNVEISFITGFNTRSSSQALFPSHFCRILLYMSVQM